MWWVYALIAGLIILLCYEIRIKNMLADTLKVLETLGSIRKDIKDLKLEIDFLRQTWESKMARNKDPYK